MTIQTVLWGLASIRCLTVHQTSCRAKTNPQQCCRRALSSRDCPRQRSCIFNMLRGIFFLFLFLSLLKTRLPKYCESPGHGNNQGVITQECLWASGSCNWLHLLLPPVHLHMPFPSMNVGKNASFPNLCWLFHVRNTNLSSSDIWSAVLNKALIFITSGKMWLGFILSSNHSILLCLHFALHLDVTCSVTRVLGTFSSPEPVDCYAMASSTATYAVGSCSASLFFTTIHATFFSMPMLPFTQKKPFTPYVIWFE